MILYNLQKNNSLITLKEKPFKLEKDIQNKRIDTLAYDKQSKAFIIIENKIS